MRTGSGGDTIGRLPDHSAHLFRPDHRISRFGAKGLLEFGQIRKRSIHPEFAERVEIRHEAAPDLLRSVVRPPDLRPRKEESLVLRESVDRRNRGLPRFRLLQRSEGNRKAAKIGNVFSQGQLAVHVHRIDTDILIELLAKN